MALNGLSDPGKIRVGQSLIVSGATQASANELQPPVLEKTETSVSEQEAGDTGDSLQNFFKGTTEDRPLIDAPDNPETRTFMDGVEKKGEAGKRLDRSIAKSGNWVSIYIVAVALGLTTLGLVMLFSAGAVRGAQSLLTKQFIWLGMSVFVGVYAAFMNLEWLEERHGFCGVCMVALALTLVPGLGVKVNGASAG